MEEDHDDDEDENGQDDSDEEDEEGFDDRLERDLTVCDLVGAAFLSLTKSFLWMTRI